MAHSIPQPRSKIPVPLLIALALLGISVFINYIDRGNLSIAAPLLKEELGISAVQLGWLLSAFFWTYATLQLFYGWLVDHLNPNWVFAAAFLVWSAATAATGLVHTFAMLLVMRLLLGIGEAAAYPSYNKILSLNFREDQRGFANSILTSGILIGPGFGILFGGLLMSRYGWRPFFLVLGLGSMLWILPWLKWMPKKHSLTAEESTGVPDLLEFLQMRSVWGTCLGLFCGNYVNYFLITWLPYYLVREREFSMDKMARVGGVAYLLAAGFTMLTGWLSDRWIRAGATPTLVRKASTGGGITIAGLLLATVPLLGPRLSVAAITAGIIFFGVASCNLWSITQRLAGPVATGRWVGFQSFTGNLAGIVAPAVTGLVLQRTGHFFWAFMIVSAAALLGAASWIFVVGPVEPVVWKGKPRLVVAERDAATETASLP